MPRTTVPKMYRFPQKTVDQIEELAARHHGLDRTKIVVAAIAAMHARDLSSVPLAEKVGAAAVGRKSRKNSG